MKAGVLVVALVLAFAGLGHGAKHKFKEGDKVTLWANKGACPWSRHGASRAGRVQARLAGQDVG